MASSDLRPPKQKTVRKKKTRELPNLSDCHACQRRTNATNPTDRLRILNSHWRIVLLCKTCYNLVQSAKSCSYCLTDFPPPEDSVSGSVHQCRKCLRHVHTTCVSRYSAFAPFSYLQPAAAFSICIDCWLPRLLDNKLRGANSTSPGIFRVSDSHERPKSLIAEAAREKTIMRAEAARGAVELDNGSVDGGGKQDEKCSDECELVDSHDKKLALRLHRAMNSSPRIGRSSHLSTTSCTKSTEMLKIESSTGNPSRLDHNINTLEPQAQIETSSIKSMNALSEKNSVNVESHSCDRKHVVVCGLRHNGRRLPECDRFSRKYTRKASSKNS